MRMNRLGAFGRAGASAWLLGAVLAAAAVPAAHGQLVPGFYVLEGANGANAVASDLSADGLTIGGHYATSNGSVAAKWRMQGGNLIRQDLSAPSDALEVFGISADGSTVVGRRSLSFFATQAIRIVGEGSVQNLGTLGSYQLNFASAANADGSVVVGYLNQPETPLVGRSFRWTQVTGMQYLPNPSGGIDATAVDITPDGSVIAGYAYTNTTKAMVWRNGVPEYLGTVPGTNFGTSYANSISEDGNVVVGNTDVPGGVHAVRWVGNEPEVLVTSAFAVTSNAWATNADGSLIGGNVLLPGSGIRPTDAFLWTAESGPIFARDYFAMHGIDIPVGTRLRAINAISADGTVFSGGLRTAGGEDIGFVVVVPAPPVMLLALIAVPCVAQRVYVDILFVFLCRSLGGVMYTHRMGILGLSGLACMAGLAIGQTSRPQFYMWEVPPGFSQGDSLQPYRLDTSADRWTFRADMQPIVKVCLGGLRLGYERAAEPVAVSGVEARL